MTDVRRVEPKHWKLVSNVSSDRFKPKSLAGKRPRQKLNWSNIKVSLYVDVSEASDEADRRPIKARMCKKSLYKLS